MVLHHVTDYKSMLKTFYKMLNSGGYLAIADLYPEDGSFHGFEVTDVHHGFDTKELEELLVSFGFSNIAHRTCFEVVRASGTKYPVFLLVAQK
jgi:ubiquinone/menaquinone biosynthesis C-methylase UbiE